jgi:formate hydrogenlyase subunit 3/multisubunit Na+/H+ antiporter MnhD subunit
MSIAPIVFDSLRLGGTFLVIIGGLWAALQNHLGRILGFTVITQIGVILFTFSLRADTTYDPLYLGVFFAWLLPLCLSMGLWGFSLYIIRNQAGDLDFRDVQGTVRRLPLATTSLLLSHLSLAGLPLLASFPISVILWSALSQQSLNSALVLLFGSASLMVAGLRSLAVLTMGGVTPGETSEENPIEPAWKISETRFQLTLLVIGGLALFVVGLMPQLFLPPLINMAFTYTNPGP